MSQDIAALKQRIKLKQPTLEQIAVMHGLPPLGATLDNQYGIRWQVVNYVYSPSLASTAWADDHIEDDPRDLRPLVHPLNLSPALLEFLMETDRCTSKHMALLDTMPYLHPQEYHPEGHMVDPWSDPYATVFHLDIAHLHEAIFAHEIGHIWIDLVEGCEHYRCLKDRSDVGKVYLFQFVQSFVLDRKVNQVLRERNCFDMTFLDSYQTRAMATLSAAVRAGYRPSTRREAAFQAIALGAALLERDGESDKALQHHDSAFSVLHEDLTEVYELAARLAASVRQYGYTDNEAIGKAVEECLQLTFGFFGEVFDPDTDLVEMVPQEAYQDKYPNWLSGLPVKAKMEAGKIMAKLQIGSNSQWRLTNNEQGIVQIQFTDASGNWTEPVILKHASRFQPSETWLMMERKRKQEANRLHSQRLPGVPMPPVPQPNVTPPGIVPPPIPGHPVNVSPPGAPQPPQPGRAPNVSPSGLPNHPVGIPQPPMPGQPARRYFTTGVAHFLAQTRLAEQMGVPSPYAAVNPYVYAMNNPTTYVDPTGRYPQLPRKSAGNTRMAEVALASYSLEPMVGLGWCAKVPSPNKPPKWDKTKDFSCKRKADENFVWWYLWMNYYIQYGYCSRCVLACEQWCNDKDTTISPEPIDIGDCKDECHKRYRVCRSGRGSF